MGMRMRGMLTAAFRRGNNFSIRNGLRVAAIPALESKTLSFCPLAFHKVRMIYLEAVSEQYATASHPPSYA